MAISQLLSGFPQWRSLSSRLSGPPAAMRPCASCKCCSQAFASHPGQGSNRAFATSPGRFFCLRTTGFMAWALKGYRNMVLAQAESHLPHGNRRLSVISLGPGPMGRHEPKRQRQGSSGSDFIVVDSKGEPWNQKSAPSEEFLPVPSFAAQCFHISTKHRVQVRFQLVDLVLKSARRLIECNQGPKSRTFQRPEEESKQQNVDPVIIASFGFRVSHNSILVIHVLMVELLAACSKRILRGFLACCLCLFSFFLSF